MCNILEQNAPFDTPLISSKLFSHLSSPFSNLRGDNTRYG